MHNTVEDRARLLIRGNWDEHVEATARLTAWKDRLIGVAVGVPLGVGAAVLAIVML